MGRLNTFSTSLRLPLNRKRHIRLPIHRPQLRLKLIPRPRRLILVIIEIRRRTILIHYIPMPYHTVLMNIHDLHQIRRQKNAGLLRLLREIPCRIHVIRRVSVALRAP